MNIVGRLHSFKLDNCLGSGDFGTVYLSQIPGGHAVAVKVFKHIENSEKELQVAKDICRSNLRGLAVLEDFGTISDIRIANAVGASVDSKFVVYTYIQKNLKQMVCDQNLKFSMQEIIQIGIELIECVEKMHSKGYLHLDIKLDNIMIDEDD